MKTLRKKIDRIDQKLIELLCQRMEFVRHIGRFKKEKRLPTQDKKREKEILQKIKTFAAEKGLSADFICRIYSHIIAESRRIQKM